MLKNVNFDVAMLACWLVGWLDGCLARTTLGATVCRREDGQVSLTFKCKAPI